MLMAIHLNQKAAPLTVLANTLGVLVLCHSLLSLGFAYAAQRCAAHETLQLVLDRLGLILPPLACVALSLLLVPKALRQPASALLTSRRWPFFVAMLCSLGLVITAGDLICSALRLVFVQDTADTVSAPATGLGWAVVLIADCLLIPLAEEWFYRGVLQRALQGWGERFAIVVTSLVFALAHFSLSQLLPLFFLSLFLGYFSVALGSARPGILLRMVYNSLGCLLTYGALGKDSLSVLGLTLIVLTACLGFGIYGAVCLRRLHPPLLPRRPDPRNRQSRAELLLTAPLFTASLITLLAQMLLQSLAG